MNKIKPRVSAGGYVVESEYIPSKWISSFRLRPSFLMWGSYRHFFYEVPATLRQFSTSSAKRGTSSYINGRNGLGFTVSYIQTD